MIINALKLIILDIKRWKKYFVNHQTCYVIEMQVAADGYSVVKKDLEKTNFGLLDIQFLFNNQEIGNIVIDKWYFSKNLPILKRIDIK